MHIHVLPTEKDGILPLRKKNHTILLPIAMRRLLILLLHKPMKNTYHKASGNMGAAVADIQLGARQCFHAEEALFSQVNATTFTNNLVLQGTVPKQVMDGMQNRSHPDMCLNVRGLRGKVPIQQVWNFEWEIPKALLAHTYTMVLLHWRIGHCFENARPLDRRCMSLVNQQFDGCHMGPLVTLLPLDML